MYNSMIENIPSHAVNRHKGNAYFPKEYYLHVNDKPLCRSHQLKSVC